MVKIIVTQASKYGEIVKEMEINSADMFFVLQDLYKEYDNNLIVDMFEYENNNTVHIMVYDDYLE